jgi:hypothetical protein
MLRLMVVKPRVIVIGSLLAAVAAFAFLSSGPAAGGDRYVGVWTGPNGAPAERGESRDRTFEVASRPMPDHCDWQDAIILQVAWPLGSTSAIGDSTEVRGFIRDPEGVLPDVPGAFRGELDLQAELPEGARRTGYRLDEVELWFGPDDGKEYAYLKRGDDVERWPREFEPIGCA